MSTPLTDQEREFLVRRARYLRGRCDRLWRETHMTRDFDYATKADERRERRRQQAARELAAIEETLRSAS